MKNIFEDEDNVLDAVKDGMLIKGILKFAQGAGIAGKPEYIWRSLLTNKDTDAEDHKIIKGLFKMSECGVVYDGYSTSLLSRKFMALTGCLVRNYRHAFYCPMGAYIAMLMDDGNPGHTVTLIPDFVSEDMEKVPSWKRDIILGLLMEKQAANQLMILGIPDADSMKTAYGSSIAEFVTGSYHQIEAEA